MELQLKPPPQVPTSRDGGTLALRLRSKYEDRVTGHFVVPPIEGSYTPLPATLPPTLRDALQVRGIEQLFSHQAAAWEASQQGEHLVIATPTASGKSLCYTLPVAAAAMTSKAKALYLFQTKALAQDQVVELIELSRAGDLGIRAATFDGDTPGDQRQAIRLNGDIVVSNPDMLHQGILPHYTKWAQFFESLQYVVIDEIHTYRGVFGSHLANVLRRLRRVCAFYGANPQFLRHRNHGAGRRRGYPRLHGRRGPLECRAPAHPAAPDHLHRRRAGDARGLRLVRPDTLLVSYNGRSYDAPLLAGRYRLARLPCPLAGKDHLDLLYPTRRRYKGRWENCRLATIERQALGIVREDDLPGSEAPGAWLGYLRGGSAERLRGVLRHNHQDVVTLAGLLRHLGEPLRAGI